MIKLVADDLGSEQYLHPEMIKASASIAVMDLHTTPIRIPEGGWSGDQTADSLHVERTNHIPRTASLITHVRPADNSLLIK